MSLHEEIAKVAHELFEKGGREHGKDREHWLEAEKIVRMSHANRHSAQKVRPRSLNAPKTAGGKKTPAARKASPNVAVSAPKEEARGNKK
jgi:hypothetical protein